MKIVVSPVTDFCTRLRGILHKKMQNNTRLLLALEPSISNFMPARPYRPGIHMYRPPCIIHSHMVLAMWSGC
jgi:hypothetical protein